MDSPSLPGLYEISKVKIRTLLPCIALASVLGGTGVFLTPTAVQAEEVCSNPYYKPAHELLKPLQDLISKGEGDYNAINRGRAGDTPGGIQGLTGQTFENYTVGQVMEMQKHKLFAVGRYQFIPKTLKFAVAMADDVSELDMFTPVVQDKLMTALVMYKRPAIGAYLRGGHEDLNWAMDEMAREWASVEYRAGRGYYDHIGGNRAHITRAELAPVLQQIKKDWLV